MIACRVLQECEQGWVVTFTSGDYITDLPKFERGDWETLGLGMPGGCTSTPKTANPPSKDSKGPVMSLNIKFIGSGHIIMAHGRQGP